MAKSQARTRARATRSHVSRKKSSKVLHLSQWRLKHLVIAAAILVALMASIPVGAYIKASVLGMPGVTEASK